MMCKLALRNVKRMAKDYVVYFMTMAVVTALMFSFNTLLFSKDEQNLFQMDAMMSVMTGLATAFIVPIIAWLINYMVRFVLEKRSREFGIYLLVGVKKKEIARLYFTENLLLGKSAAWSGRVSCGNGTGSAFSADPSVHFLQHGAAGLQTASGMEPKLYFDDGCMLSGLLSAGAVSKPKKIPQNEYP